MRAVTLSNELVALLGRILGVDPLSPGFEYHAGDHLFALLKHIEGKAKSDPALSRELEHLAEQSWESIRCLTEMMYPSQPPIDD